MELGASAVRSGRWLAGEGFEHRGGVGEIWIQRGGLVGAEFFEAVAAGGDGEGAGADGFAAIDVVRGVSHDPDAFG